MARQSFVQTTGIPKVFSVLLLALLSLAAHAQYSFSSSALKLNGATIYNPTSLQFGPDKRLYVAEQAGWIRVYTVKKNAPNDYAVTGWETISLINDIPNHNDDGTLNTAVNRRQVTGILLRGTAANPVIYVSSSDSRIGGPSGETNLDTNSGIISMLTWDGTKWVKVDLVRGLPRSEENHSVNGMQLDDKTNTLYVSVGGFTNAGAPSNNFNLTTEYALAAAIVSINLNTIMAMPTKGTAGNTYKYDLPTLDDPTRANNADGTDVNDPFGGNDGLNQAMIVPGGPVQIYAGGLRNAYDLVITKSRKMYTVDNGANQGWGGYPANEGTASVNNNYVQGEPGSTSGTANHAIVNNLDNFHYIGALDNYTPGAFYGGHPTPVRANPAGAGLYTHNGTTGVFRTSKTGTNPLPANWPPVPTSMADPREGQFQQPGIDDGSPLTFNSSTNGITEYTASNFGGALKGSLLAAEYNGSIAIIKLTADGTGVTNAKDPVTKLNKEPVFASNFGATPLDLVAQGDYDVFPGTVWAITYGGHAVTIFEPQENGSCTGLNNASDEDGDGFTNADEIANGTNPCSGSSKPADNDGDGISDLTDTDDDNDGIDDTLDHFPIDARNGAGTTLPINYNLFNNDPGTGFFGLGFTGLMSNHDSDYLKLYDGDNLIAGGAVGAFSIVDVPAGDALGALNTQKYAFQFGVATSGLPITVRSRLTGPFFNNKTPQGSQSEGIFIGNGDQDNYVKIVLNANGGAGGIQVVYEKAGVVVSSQQYAIAGGIPGSQLDLFLKFNPANNSVQPAYASGSTGAVTNVGAPIVVSGAVLDALRGNTSLAVGIIATSKGGPVFTATWDYIYVTADAVSATGTWQTLTPASGTFTGREENAYVQAGNKFYLMGGRGNKPVQEYNPVTKAWVDKAYQPIELHHFQAVTLDGLVYVVGAFTGSYPHETPVPNVYLFNPLANQWYTGSTIPTARRRGAGGTVVYNNKIYTVGGITDGHWAGWVKWFDEYDPATNTWKTLPDAPHARDHVQATVVNGKLYVAGGRRSSASTGQDFDFTVPEVDVYDFATGTWTTLPASANIPTPRSGASNVTVGNEVIVIGGESATQLAAHNETEAFDVTKGTWRTLANLQAGRHGTQAIASNGGIFTATGAGNRGGTPILGSQEVFYFYGATTPDGVTITAPELTAPGTVNFGTVALNDPETKPLVLANTSGNQALYVSAISMSGAAAFTYTSAAKVPFVIPPGGSVTLNVTFKPTSAGSQTASVSVTSSGGNVSTIVNGVGNATAYRINAGGAQVTNSIGTFAADQYYYPTPGTTKTTTANIGATNNANIYQSERNGTSFSYDFPVTNGQYKVVLHFAEITYTTANSRLFDVSIEGVKKLDNYDIIAKSGAINTAKVETFVVDVTDGTLNINFSSLAADGGKDNAKISAIEILSNTVANEPPVASAGADQSLTLPTSSTVLNGSGTDREGGIAAYTWTQVSGPNLATFSNKTVAKPTVSNLQYGIYVFRLVVTDNGGAQSAPDDVTVVVHGAPGTANAPTLLRLNGGGGPISTSRGNFVADSFSYWSVGVASSTNPIAGTTDDNLYQTYRWGYEFGYKIPVNNGNYKVVLHFAETYFTAPGKRMFDIWVEGTERNDNYDIFAKVGANTATTETYYVTVGDREIELYFISKAIHGGADNALICGIEIIPANTTGNEPVADAGPAKVLTLPTSSTVLNGSGTDPDGTITGFTWTQVSGPNAATFSSKTVAAPTVSGLVQGTYTFSLVVKDNAGNTSAPSQVTVTVNSSTPGNETPVANAGADQTITLPTSSVILSGSGSDADGTIAAYTWSQVSGPNTATFSSKTVAAPTVSGLAQGTYVFALIVKDNNSASSTADQVTVTVKAAPGPGTSTYRINAGGPSVTNSIGTFAADKYFVATSGGANSTTTAIGGTTNGAIYQTERWGYTFGYAFPVTNGQYKVILHFAEIYWTTAGNRIFDVSVEGEKKLDNYDIAAKVGGFKATTETFVTTVVDGTLNIDFSAAIADGGKDNAKVSAIEIVPATTGGNTPPTADAGNDKIVTLPTSSVVLDGTAWDTDGSVASYTWSQVSGPNTATFSSKTVAKPTVSGLVQGSYVFSLMAKDNSGALSAADEVTVTVNAAPVAGGTPVYRINSGGPQVTNSIGTFAADAYFTPAPGNKSTTASAIAGTTDDAIYQSERWGGTFAYNLPVTNGQYTVVLHFAELTYTTVGRRIFDVSIEGAKKLDNYDIFAKAGALSAVTETFVVTVTDGTLNINFSSLAADGGKTYAKVSAIEVLSASAPPNAVPVANAGPDKSITLPTSSTVLNGSGTDSDGSISGYTWTQVSGPNTATFSSKTVAAPTVSGLVQGTYTFSLVVTDNAGVSGTADEVTVSVNGAPANTPAVTSFTLVNADTDQDIMTLASGSTLNLATLPTRNLNIRANVAPGTASVVMSMSGPVVRGQTESTAPFALFGDDAGDYSAWIPPTGSYSLVGESYSGSGGSGTAGTSLTVVFEVIDNNGTVTPTNNVPPKANAGADKAITLPTSSVMLQGSVKDADGTVVSVKWTQVSGPNTANFSSTTILKPTLSGLVAGTYVFALVATDNAGAKSAPDEMTVTVSNGAVTRMGSTARTEATVSKADNKATAGSTEDVQVKVYPNPTPTGPVQLAFSKPVGGELVYSLYAPNGSRVLVNRTMLAPGTTMVTMNLGRMFLNNGIYYLEVEIEGQRRTVQLVISNR